MAAKEVKFSVDARDKMLREVASKTNDTAGDGTTTATVLAQAIVREGGKSVAAGMNPMDLKRGIDMAVIEAVSDLKRRSKKIKTSEEIAQVGAIAANGEKMIGGQAERRSHEQLKELNIRQIPSIRVRG